MAGVKGMRGGGGSRPGAGRKTPRAGQRKVPTVISITEDQREDLNYLRSRGVDTNAVIGREIHRLADALAIAEAEVV